MKVLTIYAHPNSKSYCAGLGDFTGVRLPLFPIWLVIIGLR